MESFERSTYASYNVIQYLAMSAFESILNTLYDAILYIFFCLSVLKNILTEQNPLVLTMSETSEKNAADSILSLQRWPKLNHTTAFSDDFHAGKALRQTRTCNLCRDVPLRHKELHSNEKIRLVYSTYTASVLVFPQHYK